MKPTMKFVALALLLFTALSANMLLAKTIYVPDDYPTIQEAVNHAANGDKVVVRSGTYTEAGLKIVDKKNFTVEGEMGAGSTFVVGDGNLPVLSVAQSSDIQVIGLALLKGAAGVRIGDGNSSQLLFRGLNISQVQDGFSLVGNMSAQVRVRQSAMDILNKGVFCPSLEGTGEVSLDGVSVKNGVNSLSITTVKAGAKVNVNRANLLKAGDAALSFDTIEGFLTVSNTTVKESKNMLKATTVNGSVSVSQSSTFKLSGIMMDVQTITGSVGLTSVEISENQGFMVKVNSITGSLKLNQVNGTTVRGGIDVDMVEATASIVYTRGTLTQVSDKLFKVNMLKGKVDFNYVNASAAKGGFEVTNSTLGAELSYQFGHINHNGYDSVFELFGKANFDVNNSSLNSIGGGIRYYPSENFSLGLSVDSVEMKDGNRDVRGMIFLEWKFDEQDILIIDQTDFMAALDSLKEMDVSDLVRIENCSIIGADVGLVIVNMPSVQMFNSMIKSCNIGVENTNCVSELTHNVIANNNFGIKNNDTQCPGVQALENYWGEKSGPLDNSPDTLIECGYYNPDGEGDPVTDYVEYGDFVNKKPNLEIVLIPPADVYARRGESRTVHIRVTNKGETKQIRSVWINTTRPGRPTRTIPPKFIDMMNPITITLEPGEVQDYYATITVPMKEPFGTHDIIGYIGIYEDLILDKDLFQGYVIE